jgi:excisionase family DNA binding protein
VDWPAPLTVTEVAAELQCSVDEVRALIRDGELQTVACGIRPGLVPRHQLDDYLRRLRYRLRREREERLQDGAEGTVARPGVDGAG